VLTGAVQREGDLIQVSAQVTDGETGASVWSNRWQGQAAGNLLALQADVADGVASTLGSRNFFAMKAIGAARAKAPEARTAYDLFALGYAAYLKGTADGFAESKRYFDAAIAKDPRLTLAYVQRGWATWLYAIVAGADEGAALAETERYVRKAIEIDPLDAEAHVELAAKLALFGDFALSEAEIERSLRLNPKTYWRGDAPSYRRGRILLLIRSSSALKARVPDRSPYGRLAQISVIHRRYGDRFKRPLGSRNGAITKVGVAPEADSAGGAMGGRQ
jgi:tetratricopeptide (TPR) repeat protein